MSPSESSAARRNVLAGTVLEWYDFYNLGLGIFGGTAPLIATYLVARTADDFTPAYYVMAMAVVSFVALLGLPETAGTRLA
jgi:hypothetical protein